MFDFLNIPGMRTPDLNCSCFFEMNSRVHIRLPVTLYGVFMAVIKDLKDQNFLSCLGIFVHSADLDDGQVIYNNLKQKIMKCQKVHILFLAPVYTVTLS